MPEKSPHQLIQQTRDSYGDSFATDLFAQYKLYVRSAERISERRETANNYLLTVNAFLVTLFGLFSAIGHEGYWTILVPIAGVLIGLTWYRIITSYRDLNTIKFKVIHELEQQMPATPYAYEWYKAEGGAGKAYQPLSHLERWIPAIFIVLYVLLAIIDTLGWTRPAGHV